MTSDFQLDDIYNVLIKFNEKEHEDGNIIFTNVTEHYIEFQYFWSNFVVWTKIENIENEDIHDDDFHNNNITYDFICNQGPNIILLKNRKLIARFLNVENFENIIFDIFDAIAFDDSLEELMVEV